MSIKIILAASCNLCVHKQKRVHELFMLTMMCCDSSTDNHASRLSCKSIDDPRQAKFHSEFISYYFLYSTMYRMHVLSGIVTLPLMNKFTSDAMSCTMRRIYELLCCTTKIYNLCCCRLVVFLLFST